VLLCFAWPALAGAPPRPGGEGAAQGERAEPAAQGYRVLGRLRTGHFVPDVRELDSKAQAELLQRGAGAGACPGGGLVGRATAPAATGAELGFWLALADLYRQEEKLRREQVRRRGRGTLLHVQNIGGKQIEKSGGEHANASVMRDVVEFVAASGTICRGQIKVFQRLADEWVSPAERAVARFDKEKAKTGGRAALLGREPCSTVAAGQLLWEMGQDRPNSEAAAQPGTPRAARANAANRDGGAAQTGFSLRIHIANDADNRSGGGEVRDYALVCKSKEPLWARRLSGYEHSVRDDGKQGWTVCVWPTSSK
jgi:hypothetical protein